MIINAQNVDTHHANAPFKTSCRNLEALGIFLGEYVGGFLHSFVDYTA